MTGISVRGVEYRVERFGSDGTPDILLIHGFTGRAESWEHLAQGLRSAGRRPLAVDLPGHGGTDVVEDLARYTLPATARDFAAIIQILGGAPIDVLGYSMGGRVALQLALDYPRVVRRLVLESASPGIVDAEARTARVRSDEDLARLLEAEGISAFVDRWEKVPLFASQDGLALAARERLRATRLSHDPRGLARSLRGGGQGVTPAVHDRLGELAMPVLVIVGECDERYQAIGARLSQSVRNVQTVIVPEAGHTVHLESPARYASTVQRFLGGARP
ncbi:MAG: 2-succinyl-6-hydroxy-2,4-cyclohexadiene-1-carboxylate synthase [Chloroflexi bacterium]|nr:2-succinyl-6-hydroxy-2,4-cyclohexadiene-1-carboxylate synthase [Chloroflexota bacterium]